MPVITVFEKPGAVWRANENKFLEALRQAGPLASDNRKCERMRHHVVPRVSCASPPTVTGPAATAGSQPRSPGRAPGPPQQPPALGRRQRFPCSKPAEAPPAQPACPPVQLAHPRPRRPRPAAPRRRRPAVSSVSARANGGPQPGPAAPARPCPAGEPSNFPPRAAGGGRAHPRAGGRPPRARQRRPPRLLGSPQRPGSGSLTVHAWRPAPPRPGRYSAT